MIKKLKFLFVQSGIKVLNRVLNYIHIERINAIKVRFYKVGDNFRLGKDFSIMNPNYIQVGHNFSASNRFRIEAWDKYENDTFIF